MPLARLDFGPIFRDAGWLDVLAFFLGLACLIVGVGLVSYRFPPAGRAGRFGIMVGVAGGLIGVVYVATLLIDAFGYVPAGWLERFGTWWMVGVGLVGGGMAVTTIQRADPPRETRAERRRRARERPHRSG
jgi:hypothetical protein